MFEDIEQMASDKKTMVDKIKAIMDYYGISDFEIPDKLNHDIKASASKRLAFYLTFTNVSTISSELEVSRKELAEFIKFLRACEGSAITLKGIITNPQKNDIKGTEKITKISDKYFLSWLELFVNTWLEREQDEIFQYLFKWESKKPLSYTNKEGEKEDDCFFTEPYSNEEIEEIISFYGKEIKSYEERTKNGELGRLASKLLSIIEPVKQEWTQTKLYSFVYDIMKAGGKTGKKAITGKDFSGDIGREKSQQVRNWIKAYNRDLERL